MAEAPEWKKVLRETNSYAWIAFFILVVAIGIGTLFFEDSPKSKAPAGQAASVTGSTK